MQHVGLFCVTASVWSQSNVCVCVCVCVRVRGENAVHVWCFPGTVAIGAKICLRSGFARVDLPCRSGVAQTSHFHKHVYTTLQGLRGLTCEVLKPSEALRSLDVTCNKRCFPPCLTPQSILSNLRHGSTRLTCKQASDVLERQACKPTVRMLSTSTI